METQKQRAGYASKEQKRRLIEFLDADPELRSAKFSANFTHKVAQLRWVKIANELNGLGPAHKSWDGWRKCYQDKKAKTKKKASAQNRCSSGTGGGGPQDELDEEEKMLLGSISTASIIGHAGSTESKVTFMSLIKDKTETVEPQTKQTDEIEIEVDGFEPAEISVKQLNEAGIEKIDLTTECLQNKENSPPALNTDAGVSNVTKAAKHGKKDIPMTRRRTILKRGTDAASALQKSLEEKNKYKKIFYETYIQHMSRQTDALVSIANSLAAMAHSNI